MCKLNEWNLCGNKCATRNPNLTLYTDLPPILFPASASPKYRWLGLEEFFRKYHFIKTHDDNKNEKRKTKTDHNDNDKFSWQTEGWQKDRRKPSRSPKSWALVAGLGCWLLPSAASWSNELKLKDKHFNNIELGGEQGGSGGGGRATACN